MRYSLGKDNTLTLEALTSIGKIPRWGYSTATHYTINSDDAKITIDQTEKEQLIIKAPYIDEVEEMLMRVFNVVIFLTPRFDGWDRAQIGYHYDIYVQYEPGGKDYAINGEGSYGDKREAFDQAISDVLSMIMKGDIKRKNYDKDTEETKTSVEV